MKRLFGFQSSTPAKQTPHKTNAAATKKPARPAIVQYLDEHGNPVGAPVKMAVPTSSRSSSVASSSRNSINSRSTASRRTSMSSVSSVESTTKAVSKRGSRGSLAATPASSNVAQQAEKPAVRAEEVKPAKFNGDQAVSKHKGKCESCSASSKQPSPMTASKQPRKIANRPSIEALIVEQQKSRFPRPLCEHDELELEEYLGYGYTDWESFTPQKTSKGQLVWVFKPNSGRRWRD